jgi:hypothetical protein
MLRRAAVIGVLGRVTLICVLHPVGPLPASVYWRRRIVVLAAALAGLLVLWLLAGSGGGESTGPTTGAASNATISTDSPSPSARSTATTPPASVTLAATPPAHDPGPAGGSAGSGGADGSGGPSGATGPAPTQAAVPPACPDPALRLTIASAQPAYPVGAMPVLTLAVQNVSRGTCVRDLAASQQEVLLYAGKFRLWSSNDCYPGGGRDIEALAPGERDQFSVTWSGLSSRPRCAGTRTRVGPGHYRLIGRIGTLRSAPTPLILR